MRCCLVCLWGWGGVRLQHRPCEVLSCMSVGLGWGGVTPHTMYVCRIGLGGVGVGVELQHRPCDVLSCMSVGLGSVGWGGVGWSYN